MEERIDSLTNIHSADGSSGINLRNKLLGIRCSELPLIPKDKTKIGKNLVIEFLLVGLAQLVVVSNISQLIPIQILMGLVMPMWSKMSVTKTDIFSGTSFTSLTLERIEKLEL